jgi:hypothetical protein
MAQAWISTAGRGGQGNSGRQLLEQRHRRKARYIYKVIYLEVVVGSRPVSRKGIVKDNPGKVG